MQVPNGEKKNLSVHELVEILKIQQKHIQELKQKLNNANLELEILRNNNE